MNEQAILNAMYDGIIVKCTFDTVQRSKLSEVVCYSYKSNIDLTIGDMIVVPVAQSFKIATVVEITDSLDMEPDIAYKWIVCKLNLESYINLSSKDDEAIRQLRRIKQINIRKQMVESAGITESELSRILMIANGRV